MNSLTTKSNFYMCRLLSWIFPSKGFIYIVYDDSGECEFASNLKDRKFIARIIKSLSDAMENQTVTVMK